jgi:CRISPR-associated protein (TIGR02710 family)
MSRARWCEASGTIAPIEDWEVDMPGGLILTVGDSPEPIEFSLKDRAPDYVCFLCTPQSRTHLDRIVAGACLTPSRYQVFEVDDRPAEAARLAHHVLEAHRWLRARGLASGDIAVDATGGRKWMSSAATLMAGALSVPMSYVEVRYREGRPDPTTMQLVSLANVLVETGIVELNQAVSLFNAGEFAASAALFGAMNQRASDAEVRELAGALADLSLVLEKWDRFLHLRESLADPLENICVRLARSRYLAEAAQPLVAKLGRLQMAASALIQGTGPVILADLIANARRCQRRGRYDDAVARAYRTLEATAQWILAETHGLQTGAVQQTAGKLKPETRTALGQRRAGQLPNEIGLEEAWWVLALEGHRVAIELGEETKDGWRLGARLRGLLKSRNLSILAHGFEDVSGKSANDLLNEVEQVLRRVVGSPQYDELRDQIVFPELPPLPVGKL